MIPRRCLAPLCVALLVLSVGAAPSATDREAAEPAIVPLQGLPAPEGRQLFAGDEAGNAYIVQLAEQRVYEVDETGRARHRLDLVSDTAIEGALRAAVGDEGETWVFGFAPYFVRVFVNGEEIGTERVERTVTGMTVTGGRPTLALIPGRLMTGADVAREDPRPKTVPLVVQLDAEGEWQPWIEYEPDEMDFHDFLTFGGMGQETRLAGDRQGRLAMARVYRYEVREYAKSGRLRDRLQVGEIEKIDLPEPDENGRIQLNRTISSSEDEPMERVIEGVVWSPDGEIVLLVRPEEGGYALDRWTPALAQRERLPVPQLDGERGVQMAAGRTGLMLLPASSTRMVVLPWDYLRDAEWVDPAPTTGAEPTPEAPAQATEPSTRPASSP